MQRKKWIPSYALKHRDWWAIMGAIARGVSRVGHHEFMDTIWNAGKRRAGEAERIEVDRLKTLDESEPRGESTICTLPTGIVAWYKAEDNAHDAVGNNHGTEHAITYGPGVVGRAFQFDGEGFVRVPDAPLSCAGQSTGLRSPVLGRRPGCARLQHCRPLLVVPLRTRVR